MALFARANVNAAFLTNNCYVYKLTGEYHVVPHDENYVSFEKNLDRRRQEANRTILVQVQSPKSSKDLYTYCKQYGIIDHIHHHSIKNDINLHFFLIEFNKSASAQAALKAAIHSNKDAVIPTQSHMLWFRNSKTGATISAEDKGAMDLSVISTNSRIPEPEEIMQKLHPDMTISNQMKTLYNICKLDELGIRLRFLTAHQLERSFIGFFPDIMVLPFGSSVNGFGRRDCDLDLVVMLENEQMEKSSSRLVFQAKSTSTDGKTQWKQLMQTIADTLQFFIPGASNVRRILQARVPIIKYKHTLTGIECDLSMANMTAVHMSKLLCLYGEIDYRVRPLVFTIRFWAHRAGLTYRMPGPWITNFSITLLVMFYLQQKGILPSLNELQNLAGTNNTRMSRHAVNCTFLRDVTKLPSKNVTNTDTLEYLLLGFFSYYSNFDFSTQAISIREGKSLYKPDSSPLHICNPLEPALNVSKNINVEETEKLKLAVRTALWILETASDTENPNRGILSIFEGPPTVDNYTNRKRVVNIAELLKIPHGRDVIVKNRSIGNGTSDHTYQQNNVDGIANKNKGLARRR